MEEHKKVEEVIDDRAKKIIYGFATMMDAFWGNDIGTKGVQDFLKQDSSVLEKENYEP